MSIPKGGFRGRAVLIGLALALGLALLNPPAARAASVRVMVWDFNACDQYGRGNPDCQVTPAQRASAIAQSLNSTSWPPNVATFQEMCRSTYDMVVGALTPGWGGQFYSTYTTTDSRCQSVDHAWGIALLARSAVVTSPRTFTLGVETSGERRTLLCIDVRVGIPMRTCTTHLTSTSQATAAAQASKAADIVDPWLPDTTVVVGGDLNLDVRQCENADVRHSLGRWYYGTFGAGVSRCYSGSGSMYEADHYRPGGDGVYDEDTLGSTKIDFVFGNRQRVSTDYAGDATSSSVSDHDPLHGAMTTYDRNVG